MIHCCKQPDRHYKHLVVIGVILHPPRRNQMLPTGAIRMQSWVRRANTPISPSPRCLFVGIYLFTRKCQNVRHVNEQITKPTAQQCHFTKLKGDSHHFG